MVSDTKEESCGNEQLEKIEREKVSQKWAKLEIATQIVLVVGVLCILHLRGLNESTLRGTGLWAEDGSVFMVDALNHGLASVVKPYSGYLHLYPRLIALTSTLRTFTVPWIFTLGWLLSFFLMWGTIYCAFRPLKFGASLSSLVVLGIVLQPNTGEVFFNLTNSQWFLAIGMSVYSLLCDVGKHKTIAFAMLMTLGLTGPFSIILVPPLLVKWYFARDFQENRSLYVAILISALIQLLFVMQSQRLEGVVSSNVFDWIDAVVKFMSFGTSGAMQIVAIFMWLCYLLFVVSGVRSPDVLNTETFKRGLFLLIAMVFFYVAGLWVYRDRPALLSPMGFGARYFFIPYSLAIIAFPFVLHKRVSLLALGHEAWGVLLSTMFVVVSIFQFSESQIERPDLQFQSYRWWASKKPDVSIPINPGGIWDIKINATGPQDNFRVMTIKKAKVSNGKMLSGKGTLLLASEKTELQFSIPPQSHNSKNIGIEIELVREFPGTGQMSLGNEKSLDDQISITREYPAGAIYMQFAFPLSKDANRVRFNPTTQIETILIKEVRIYFDSTKS